ncbi:hypothetical protein ACFFWD_18045 [Bradyrhizobium erythrophlei]|uniref:hypothetical protein n=1 Tax=Bradyrhizobium erythrophlei TaxID=1437360 RepID=UPI0035EA5F5F
MNPARRLLQLWIVLSFLWCCVAGPISILIWKRDADARAYARASAAIWAKYESDCSKAKKKGPLCDFPPVAPRASAIPKAVYPVMLLGPPVLFFLFGWMRLLVARGKASQ